MPWVDPIASVDALPVVRNFEVEFVAPSVKIALIASSLRYAEMLWRPSSWINLLRDTEVEFAPLITPWNSVGWSSSFDLRINPMRRVDLPLQSLC